MEHKIENNTDPLESVREYILDITNHTLEYDNDTMDPVAKKI